MSEKTAESLEELASAIAADLFVDGQGKPARRLVMERHDRRIDGTGWSEAAVRDRVLSRLRAAPEVAEPPKLEEAEGLIDAILFRARKIADAYSIDEANDFFAMVQADAMTLRHVLRAALRSPRIEGDERLASERPLGHNSPELASE